MVKDPELPEGMMGWLESGGREQLEEELWRKQFPNPVATKRFFCWSEFRGHPIKLFLTVTRDQDTGAVDRCYTYEPEDVKRICEHTGGGYQEGYTVVARVRKRGKRTP